MPHGFAKSRSMFHAQEVTCDSWITGLSAMRLCVTRKKKGTGFSWETERKPPKACDAIAHVATPPAFSRTQLPRNIPPSTPEGGMIGSLGPRFDRFQKEAFELVGFEPLASVPGLWSNLLFGGIPLMSLFLGHFFLYIKDIYYLFFKLEKNISRWSWCAASPATARTATRKSS